MEKKNWAKELFRPENKKARINLFTAFLIGILLLLMSHIFFEPPEQQAEAIPQIQEQTEQKQYNTEEEIEKNSKDWMLLYQMGVVEKDGFELMFGDVGHIYFWIKKQDLEKRNFDNVWLILQCC